MPGQHKAPFPYDPQLTAIAIAYRNTKYIADQVCPRAKADKEIFQYKEFPVEERYTVPDTRVGRKGRPNEVEFGFVEKEASTNDEALDSPIPMKDIENAPKGYSPINHAVEATTDLIMLGREKRVATLYQNAANYSAHNVEALSDGDYFDQPTSKPIDVITDLLDTPLMRPNEMTLSRPVASKLLRHPSILKGFHGNDGDSGMATIQYLSELFELDAIHVGEARINTTRRGREPAIHRLWGPDIALTYTQKMNVVSEGTMTWAFTPTVGTKRAGAKPDPDISAKGGYRVRVMDQCTELVIAKEVGALIQNVLSPT